MKLPPGFVPGFRRDDNWFFESYVLQTDDTVKFYLEYRGRRMTEKSAAAFHGLLQKAPHNLALTEIENHRELLQARSDINQFRVMVAKTQDLGGKRLLVVEGIYVKHQLQARTMFVDTDGTGGAVQEISFQTPTDKFIKYLLAGTRTLETIVWK